MGVETELFGLKNRYDGKEFRVIEREDGTIAVLAGDKVLVDSGVSPVTASPSEGLLAFPGSGIRSDSDLYLFNYDPAQYSRFRAAVAGTLANVADTKVGIVSDSTGRGAVGGSGTVTQAGGQAASWPRKLAERLNAYFCPASNASVFGDGGMGSANFDVHDVRCARQAFASAATSKTIGGAYWAVASGTGAGFKFTPVESVDTFDIQVAQGPYSFLEPALQFYIDGAAPASGPATFNCNQAPMQLSTITVGAASAGTHQLEVRPTTASKSTYKVGIRARNSAIKRILIDNLGWAGSSPSNWAANTGWPTDPMPALTYQAYDLTIIPMTINPINAGVSADTWAAGMQPIITNAKAGGGNVLLVMGTPCTKADTDYPAAYSAYWAAMQALAVANNCAAVNLRLRWGSGAAAVNAGFLDSVERLHPTKSGYGDISSAYYSLVRRIAE